MQKLRGDTEKTGKVGGRYININIKRAVAKSAAVGRYIKAGGGKGSGRYRTRAAAKRPVQLQNHIRHS